MDSVRDNLRLFLWITFLALLWLAYTTWTNDYSTAVGPVVTPPGVAAAPDSPTGSETLPSLDQPSSGAPTTATAPPAPVTAVPAGSDLIRVRTDVLDVQINLQGGDLVRADLRAYPVRNTSPTERCVCSTTSPTRVGYSRPES